MTPENIAIQYHLSGVGRRTAAFLLDLAVRFAGWVGLLICLSLLNAFSLFDPMYLFAGLLLLLYISEWFYGALFETYWNGQTIGKRIQGIRVIQTNGQPINGMQAVLRNVLRTVDIMPLIPIGEFLDEDLALLSLPTFLFGILAIMANRRMQRLGDLVCGTMVVLDEQDTSHRLQQMDWQPALQMSADLPAHLHLTRQQGRAIIGYVARRKGISEARRRELALPLAKALAARWEGLDWTDPDRLLCAVYHRLFIYDPAGAEERGSSETLEPQEESAGRRDAEAIVLAGTGPTSEVASETPDTTPPPD